MRGLLAQSEKYLEVRRGKQPAASDVNVRSQFGIAYKWIIANGLRKRKGAIQLEINAARELAAGRPQLLEFVKKFRPTLEDQLETCWSIHDAPERLQRLSKTRVDLSLSAAEP